MVPQVKGKSVGELSQEFFLVAFRGLKLKTGQVFVTRTFKIPGAYKRRPHGLYRIIGVSLIMIRRTLLEDWLKPRTMRARV